MNRLTIIGWFVFLLSVACGVIVGTVFLLWWQKVFTNAQWRVRTGPAGLVVVGTIVGLFIFAKKLFKLADIDIVREAPDSQSAHNAVNQRRFVDDVLSLGGDGETKSCDRN